MEIEKCPQCGVSAIFIDEECPNCRALSFRHSLLGREGRGKSEEPPRIETHLRQAARAEIVRRATMLVAGSIIAEPSFPEKSRLPQMNPIPFTNFGHQPLFDHVLLNDMIWGIIGSIQKALVPWRRRNRLLNWLIGSMSILLAGIAGAMSESVSAGVVMLAIALIFGLLWKQAGDKSYQNQIRDIRAAALQEILENRWTRTPEVEVKKKIREAAQKVGSGICEGGQLPVLVVREANHPFPGFGRLQNETTYVCRPRDAVHPENDDSLRVEARLWEALKQGLDSSRVDLLAFGEVICLHGPSVAVNSVWLDKNSTPVLYAEPQSLHRRAPAVDPASARKFYFIEILFPAYSTAAFFFLRPFLAGNALGCHLVLTTLGPPVADASLLQKAILRYKLKTDESSTVGNVSLSSTNRDPLNLIRLIGSAAKERGAYQHRLNLSEIAGLEFPDEESALSNMSELERSIYKDEHRELLKSTTSWPGAVVVQSQNMREDLSYTFTTDFFGRPESVASVRALYDEVSRAILNAMDKLGYDVSGYRDKEGHFIIKADSIEQLVVGERIHLEKSQVMDTKPAVPDNKQQSNIP